MTSEELKTKVSRLQQELQELKDRLETEAQNLFTTTCTEIFANYPCLQSFSWRQYTPYFNDGDTCEFSAYTDSIYLNGSEDEACTYALERLIGDIQNKDEAIAQHKKALEKADPTKWEYRHIQQTIKEIEETDIETARCMLSALQAINELMASMSEEVLLGLFGDHARVVVTKDGAEVESYEHD